MMIHTEQDVEYDRRHCNAVAESGGECQVLTDHPPLWPVLTD
jgi:hypothetical protein